MNALEYIEDVSNSFIQKNVTINDATGIVDIDLSKPMTYKIIQGAGDLTLNVISTADARAEGLISILKSPNFALSYTGVSLTGPNLFNVSFLDQIEYDNVSFGVAGQDTFPRGITFSPDGTKMFIVGSVDESIYQYTLTTGFDLTTASYDDVSFGVSAQDTDPRSIAFNNDGTKMIMVGKASSSAYQYTLTTGYDLTTASYDNVNYVFGSPFPEPTDIMFNSDGTKLIISTLSRTIQSYTLTTGFDLSTASYDNISFNVNSVLGSPNGFTFNTEGTKLFVIGSTGNTIFQFTLLSGFDLSTASYDNVSFNTSAQTSSVYDVTFDAKGSKLFITGGSGVFEYLILLKPVIQTTKTYGNYPQIITEKLL